MDKKLQELFEKGNALYEKGQFEEALLYYDQIIELEPECAAAYNNKGSALNELKRYEEALACYDLAIKLDPNYAYAYNGKGNALSNLKRYEEALACYDQAIKLDPKYAVVYNNKGNALKGLKRYEEALACYDQAIELDPNYAYAYNNKGSTLNELKRYEEALACFDLAIKLDPKYAVAYNNKGNTLNNLKRYEEALACYDQAIKLDPNYAYAYNGKGSALNELKRCEEALTCFDQAIDLDPKCAAAYNGKGIALANLKRYEEAQACFAQAIQLGDSKAMYNRALLYEKMGQLSEASKGYADYLEQVPGDAAALYRVEALAKKTAGKKAPKPAKRPAKPAAPGKADGDKPDPATENANWAVTQFKADEDSGVTEFSDPEEMKAYARSFERIRKLHDNEAHKRTEKAMEKIKRSFRGFTAFGQSAPIDGPEFYVLRRWNSYTPIVARNHQSSKGGGYYLHLGASGVAIDPGLNFIENFQDGDFKFNQLSAIFITHAHNDHAADLESILTLLHVYNKDHRADICDEIAEQALKQEFPGQGGMSREDLLSSMRQERKKRCQTERKVVDIYLTASTFKKYAAMLELRGDVPYRVHLIRAHDARIECVPGSGIYIRPIPAKHFDLISDRDAIGLVIELPQYVLVYTGDTGFSPRIGAEYRHIGEQYRGKPILLLAHIGGFKQREAELNADQLLNGKAFYKDHLGRNGLICLVDALQPQFCLVSEFGEEFNGLRVDLADQFAAAFENEIPFLPADIGLCVDKAMRIWAIYDWDTNSQGKQEMQRKFIEPQKVVAHALMDASLEYFDRSENASPLVAKLNDRENPALRHRRPIHKPKP